MGEGTSVLETGVEKEIGVVIEGDVLAGFQGLALNDSKFDNGRRINGSTIAIGY